MRSSTTMTAAQKNRKLHYYSFVNEGPKKGNSYSVYLFIWGYR
jgi:hypothetical protein